LVIGVLTNHRMEAKVKLYRKKFGKPAGAFFVVGGKWAKGCEPYDIDIWTKEHDARGNPRDNHKKPVLHLNLGNAQMTTAPLPMMPIAKAG
jgi:hypothetical protein